MARRALALLAFGLSATVDAATTCASLACLEDLLAVTGENRCGQYSTDEEACVKAYMKRMDGTFSPCVYSPDDPERYKPEDNYDARCHSSRDV